jgi:hypothetical protein
LPYNRRAAKGENAMSHTITVTISETARKEAVLLGLPAQVEQEYVVPTELLPDLFELGAKLNNAGNVNLRVGRAYMLDTRPTDAKSAISMVKDKVSTYHNSILTKAMGGENLTWNELRILSPDEINAYNYLRERVQHEKFARARADIARKKADQEEARAKALSEGTDKATDLLKKHQPTACDPPRDEWQTECQTLNLGLLDLFFL